MNQKEKNLKFKEKINNDSNIKSLNSQNKRNNIKLKLMDKYNISPEDTERILSKIEKKEEINNIYKKQNSRNNIKIDNSNQIKQYEDKIANSRISGSTNVQSVSDEKAVINNLNFKNKDVDTNFNIDNDGNNSPIPQYELKKKQINKHTSMILNNNAEIINEENIKNVDSILGDIIPNYNQHISIKLDHVDLTFEVSNEKIDTLKETFIRFLKKNNSKKIKIHALKDVSFEIYKGEKVGIIGYNGAGKSTLLSVITGIYTPDKGNVTTFGNISPLLSLGAGFDPNFSGRRNIILNGAVLGYDKTYLESKIDEIIEFSELGEFIDIPIKNYSSGMLAKLGFSIATSVNPDILIIDEILGVGDVNFSKKSKDKIRSLMDGGTTVLLVSHSIPQIRELCDKAIWIDKGCVKDIGEVNKICDAYLKDAEKASNKELANIQLVN